MNSLISSTNAARTLRALSLAALTLAASAGDAHAQTPAAPAAPAPNAQAAPTPAAATTPSETVRAFYKALAEKRFREAFALSIYRPAVEVLTPEEYEDLRPDFERIAAAVSDKIQITGEQMSGDTATVYVRATGGDDAAPPEPVTLVRAAGGAWVVGDRDAQELVNKGGRDFFFQTRIDTHHSEVKEMMKRISVAQLIYSSQHGGAFGDLGELVRAGLVPQDLLGTDSTGYHFRVEVERGGKGFRAAAEPARYGRTGRLSFHLDQAGLRSEDNGGKPLKPSKK